MGQKQEMFIIKYTAYSIMKNKEIFAKVEAIKIIVIQLIYLNFIHNIKTNLKKIFLRKKITKNFNH